MQTIEFTGKLTEADTKRHISHVFTVPDGVQSIAIDLMHAPHKAADQPYPNQVSLSLFDPNGSRGARHNNQDQSIKLIHHNASKGYLPGPLVPGEWDVVLDTHRILGDDFTYTITVTLSEEPVPDDMPTNYIPGTTADRGAGWYRGDLHSHTNHTDGKLDVVELAQYARDFKLDFLALTDHNTVSPLAEFHSYADDDLITIGGMELTTYYGHCLALGTSEWQEWRLVNGLTMPDLAQRIMDTGAFYVIAHPRSIGDPRCTGCRWEFEDMMPGNAPAVEVWNGLWNERNAEGVALFYEWLNAGHRLVCTAGTDLHAYPRGNIRGAAVNVVYAEHYSAGGILAGLHKGNSYLSAGPTLSMKLSDENVNTALIGDTLPGSTVSYDITVSDYAPGDTLRVIADGHVLETVSLDECEHVEGRQSPNRWMTFEVHDETGDMRLITNPVFVTLPSE
ncbi:MAG: CehA/McbA family metallohydrolase [Chloroflexota bacterium]